MEKKCLNCGEIFILKRIDRKYCSNSCKTKAYNKRENNIIRLNTVFYFVLILVLLYSANAYRIYLRNLKVNYNK